MSLFASNCKFSPVLHQKPPWKDCPSQPIYFLSLWNQGSPITWKIGSYNSISILTTSCGDDGSRWFLYISSAFPRNCTWSLKFFKSTHASQKIRFSSLYSVFKKVPNIFRPVILDIKFSKPFWGSPQQRISLTFSSFSSFSQIEDDDFSSLKAFSDFLDIMLKKLRLLFSLFFTERFESELCWVWNNIPCLSSPELTDPKEG